MARMDWRAVRADRICIPLLLVLAREDENEVAFAAAVTKQGTYNWVVYILV